mmetsp:Transcript_29058/g.72798  ORF Transcript_29058/g.72798 Transcript_29058/m.72798 type:complete len:410 (-) Transcript_29058:696-1925(-)
MAGVGRALCAEPAAAAAGGARVSTHVRRGGHGAARPRHLRRVALRSALNPHNSAAAAVGVFTDEKHKLGEDVTVDFSMEASPSILQTSDDFDESQLKLPEFEDIVAAYLRIKNAIPRTPCWQSEALSRLTGATVFLKGEHNQATGSFKERGARNAMLLLTADQKRRGVVAASAGNHGLALSYHGRNLKIPVTVVMPETAPLTKISRCEALGANVVLSGKNFTEAFAKACELRDADSLTYINGYDDPPILAGAGTVGMEILEQVDELDAVVIPVGGGGLIAGMALAIKAVKRARPLAAPLGPALSVAEGPRPSGPSAQPADVPTPLARPGPRCRSSGWSLRAWPPSPLPCTTVRPFASTPMGAPLLMAWRCSRWGRTRLPWRASMWTKSSPSARKTSAWACCGSSRRRRW